MNDKLGSVPRKKERRRKPDKLPGIASPKDIFNK
jgi:hypothetical protein